jgi:hypothetical protein
VFFHELGHHVRHHSFRSNWISFAFLWGMIMWSRPFCVPAAFIVNGMCDYYLERKADEFVPHEYHPALCEYFEDALLELRKMWNDPINREHGLSQSQLPFASLRYRLIDF